MSLKEKLKNAIDSYKDFPEKGILFRDLLPVLQDVELFESLTKEMIKLKSVRESEAIIGIDARGFIFGTAISLLSQKPLVLARKPGKLPGELIQGTYNLEYGKNSLSIQKDALNNYNSYAIVDDLLATGGTVDCVAKLVKNNGKDVLGLLAVVELVELQGRSRLDFPVHSELTI